MHIGLAWLLESGLLLASLCTAVGFEPPPVGETVLWATPRGRKAAIKAAPRRTAQTLGEVRRGAEIVLRDDGGVPGRGCTRWLRALPEGYLCQGDVRLRRGVFPSEAAQAPPAMRPAPRLRYAVVRSHEAALYSRPDTWLPPVMRLRPGDGLTVLDGPRRGPLLRTASRLWVRQQDLQFAAPSTLRGLDLTALPTAMRFRLGWLVPDRGADTVPLWLPARLAGPAWAAGQESRPMPRYTRVEVLDAMQDTTRVRLLDGPIEGEVSSRHLRRVLPAPPPPGLGPHEVWIDVNLSQQVLTAYRGQEPLFSTLVSTAPHGGTPPGTYAVYRKYLTQSLANLVGARTYYDYRQVPHAQFFYGRFGLHAAMWHDLFGHPVSHGCVNLSPADAEHLFHLTEPELPPGWHSRTAPAGTRIVVHR
ncbi:MAG: L,D-transpeptidase [Myxococcales bacterium]|nr:L,D-transpeptidase [Myxococcota bacterium]MDW8281042.1 L,D-transpeptidase [Myxococcales bacterium]